MNGAEAMAYLDAEPFRRILTNRLAELEEKEWITDPNSQLAMEVGLGERVLRRILKQERMSFDIADKIVTRVLGPMAWHEDVELNQIYESVDLTSLDWSFPVSEKVRKELRETASRSIKKLGTVRAAKTLGISVAAVSRYAREARAS